MHEGARPRPGSLRMRLLLVAAVAMLAAACRAPGSDTGAAGPAGASLPRGLSEAPERLPTYERPDPLGDDAGGQDPEEGEDPSPASGSSPSGGIPGAPSAAPASARSVGSVSDRTGDAGLQTPAYADLTDTHIIEIGTTARVVVDLAADLPGRLPAGEVMGVGVDLYTGGATESDYQLFADGSSEGWLAYLQGPNGFVRYPGSFLVGGRRMVFELPWSSLGNLRLGRFGAFADWSRRATPLNTAGQDHAPDGGTAAFRR